MKIAWCRAFAGATLLGLSLASSLATAETVVCKVNQTFTCDAKTRRCTSDEMLQWDAQTRHYKKVKVLRIVFTVDRAQNQIADDSDSTYTMVPVVEIPSDRLVPDMEHSIMGVRTTPAAVDTLMLGESHFIETLVANALGISAATVTMGNCKGLLPRPTEKPSGTP